MSDTKITSFLKEWQGKKDSMSRIKDKVAQLKYREELIHNVFNFTLNKFKIMGFDHIYLDEETFNCNTEENDGFDFATRGFKITLNERNISFLFTPTVSQDGSIFYRYERYNLDDLTINNKIIWDAEKNLWFFNAGNQTLNEMPLDDKCIVMILTNMYYLQG